MQGQCRSNEGKLNTQGNGSVSGKGAVLASKASGEHKGMPACHQPCWPTVRTSHCGHGRVHFDCASLRTESARAGTAPAQGEHAETERVGFELDGSEAEETEETEERRETERIHEIEETTA